MKSGTRRGMRMTVVTAFDWLRAREGYNEGYKEGCEIM